jgi:hypothetical protein
MGYTKRNCDNCQNEYMADSRNLKRGWGLTCSKSCAASKREKSKPNYNPDTVKANNLKRELWNEGKITGRTSEGYKVIDGTAYNEFDEPMYDVDDIDEDDRGWDSHK